MRFGRLPVREAEGGIAVHSIRKAGLVLKKGTTIGRPEIAGLEAAGVADIVVARLDPGDVSEDAAAGEIAAAVAGEGVRIDRAFTGRANLFAESAGVLVVDKAAIDRLNLVDESITFATLAAYKPVVPGEMIATVKIIPFAVARAARDAALAVARSAPVLVRVAPYRIRKIGVVSTTLPGLAAKVLDKTLKVTEERLNPAGAMIIAERRVAHEEQAVAKAIDQVLKEGAELVIVFGASAIADRRDVIPAAVEAVGGRIEHFGMPVDPGNLLLVGDAGGRPVLGAPGCARSPKENGFDWVLMRLLAGLEVPREAIAGMGVGGLLMEIVTRPQPRDEPTAAGARSVAAVVLAAGRSTRMGGPNKLIAEISGKPLVRIAVEEALASRAKPVIVVTGHQRERVEAALAGLPVRLVHNPDFAQGLGTSVKAGIAAVPAESDGAAICLGDMPQVDTALIDRLIAAFDPEKGALAVVPTVQGERGNPVLWSRRFFPDLMAIEGDIGARRLIGRYGEAVVEVAVTGKAAVTDVDTPEALEVLKGEIERGAPEVPQVPAGEKTR
jgi:molybdenum cofactor cytidylyltransferase